MKHICILGGHNINTVQEKDPQPMQQIKGVAMLRCKEKSGAVSDFVESSQGRSQSTNSLVRFLAPSLALSISIVSVI
jgi:hypothetical protein